jgi:hypothetical protein
MMLRRRDRAQRGLTLPSIAKSSWSANGLSVPRQSRGCACPFPYPSAGPGLVKDVVFKSFHLCIDPAQTNGFDNCQNER